MYIYIYKKKMQFLIYLNLFKIQILLFFLEALSMC